MDEKIKLSVDLFDNALTERKGDYVGRPHSTGSFANSDIARRIVEKRTEYRLETIENILLLADQEKARAIAEGKSVTDGVGNYQLRLIGSFEGPKAPFNPEIHELNVSYSMGKTLRALLKSVVVETSPATTGAVINDVVDSATQSVNTVLTSGSTAIINGINIKLPIATHPRKGMRHPPALGCDTGSHEVATPTRIPMRPAPPKICQQQFISFHNFFKLINTNCL